MPSWKTCLRIGISVFALFLCIRYWDIMVDFLLLAFHAATPILAGGAIAFILNIPMRFFERHFFPDSKKPWIGPVRRGVCLLLAFLCVGVILTALALLVIPELIDCAELLMATVPGTLQSISAAVAESDLASPELAQWLNGLNWQELIEKAGGVLLSGFGSVAGMAAEVIGSMISITFNSLMALIFAVYVLAGKEQLGRQAKTLARKYLKKSWREKLVHVLAVVEDCFHNYIVGKGADAVVLGVMCAVGMLIFGFPFAAVVGTVVGFTALIPVIGGYIGGFIGFLLILTVSPLRAALFLLYLVILQQVEGNFIYPKIIGKTLGLPGIWVLAAVIIGGGTMGILGMLLGVPIAAAIYRLVQEDVRRRPNRT